MNVLNQGNEPTFVVCNNEKVTDLTLGTNKIGNLVSNWQASNEASSSDHRYISYQMGNLTINQVTSRDPMRTNWESYTDILKVNLETISRSICTIKETDQSVDQLQQAIILSYYQTVQPRPLAHQGRHLDEMKS
jgi:hypothetical protein